MHISEEKDRETGSPGRLEKFGINYLHGFYKKNPAEIIRDEEEVNRKIKKLTYIGMILTGVAGCISAYLSVLTDNYFEHSGFWIHYGWVAGVTLVATIIEFYFCFVISLWVVGKISRVINVEIPSDYQKMENPFNIVKILARAALEIPDPVVKILNIDPLKKVSKKRLLIIAALYKIKVMASNFLMKLILRRLIGKSILRIKVSYIAVPVTGLWNSVVLWKVVNDARLRIFGSILAEALIDRIKEERILEDFSEEGKRGCLRAIANAVVLTQNYHPNMVVLLVHFKEMLNIHEPDNFDDWERFLKTLNAIPANERNFLLELLVVAAAFDGKNSNLERKHLSEAFAIQSAHYLKKLDFLVDHIQDGRLKESLDAINFPVHNPHTV